MSRFHYYWTKSQDEMLIDMKDNQFLSFKEISLYFKRSLNKCAERYHEVKKMKQQEKQKMEPFTKVALCNNGKASRKKTDKGYIVGPYQNSLFSPTGEERYLVEFPTNDPCTKERVWVEASKLKEIKSNGKN